MSRFGLIALFMLFAGTVPGLAQQDLPGWTVLEQNRLQNTLHSSDASIDDKFKAMERLQQIEREETRAGLQRLETQQRMDELQQRQQMAPFSYGRE